METTAAMNINAPTTVSMAQKIVLHVGCGAPNPQKLHAHFRTTEWREVRLDIDPAVQPDIVASITDMAIVKTESVDAIWSSHNIEHLYPHEVALALNEFYRVLKIGGLALITLPDLQRVAEWIAQDRLEDIAYVSPAGPITPLDMAYGHRPSLARGNLFMAHKTGFTAKTLGNALVKAGFVAVKVTRGPAFDLWAVAYKSNNPETVR